MKMITAMNFIVFQKLPRFIGNSLTFISIIIVFVAFSAVGNDAPETDKQKDEVVTQAKKRSTGSIESDESKDRTKKTETRSSENTGGTTEPAKEVITGTADMMERDQKAGITILIGQKEQARTVRFNEQGVEIGFLNADRITLKANPGTGETTEIVAVGNVEIRDQDIFATCDHATLNNLTNIIVLKDNVVVLQNKDRLETKLFTFNRTTGKQTGEGDVKFKVTVIQATPTESVDEAEETGTNKDDTTTGTDMRKEKTGTSETEESAVKKSDQEGKSEENASEETESEEAETGETPEETEPAESEETEDGEE